MHYLHSFNISDIMKQKMTEKDVDNKDAMDNADGKLIFFLCHFYVRMG